VGWRHDGGRADRQRQAGRHVRSAQQQWLQRGRPVHGVT
jgi:hypothetical protein